MNILQTASDAVVYRVTVYQAATVIVDEVITYDIGRLCLLCLSCVMCRQIQVVHVSLHIQRFMSVAYMLIYVQRSLNNYIPQEHVVITYSEDGIVFIHASLSSLADQTGTYLSIRI